MRPMGVVSKKDMGDLRMLYNILMCSFLEARTILAAVSNAYTNTKKAEKNRERLILYPILRGLIVLIP